MAQSLKCLWSKREDRSSDSQHRCKVCDPSSVGAGADRRLSRALDHLSQTEELCVQQENLPQKVRWKAVVEDTQE